MSTTAIRDQLRAISFLDGLTDSAYHQLARLVAPVRYKADEMLFEEGSPRAFLALVVSGAVAIEKQMNSRPIRLVTLGAGEAVGEGLLLDDSKHGTSARALQQTDVLVLRSEKVQDMLKEHPQLYAALIGRAARAISQRLAATDATIVGRGRTLGFGGHHVRFENDLLGEREIPDDALYGVQTLRALENFPITGIALREFPALVEALAAVKEAAALANAELGLLGPEIADPIVRAAREVRTGRHHEHFLVDMIQGRWDVDEHECKRGHREPGARVARSIARRLRHDQPEYARQPEPVHERRLSHRREARASQRHRGAPRRNAGAVRLVPQEGRRVRRVPQDGPHPAAGCCAYDVRPGVQRIRSHDPRRRRPTW